MKQSGFTLIEILVAIAIIAVISSVGMVLFAAAQKKGRMAKRIEDLKAIQLAVEVYKADKGEYPYTGGPRSQCPLWGPVAADQVVPGLVPDYMPVFPSDPKMDTTSSPGGTSCYVYVSDRKDYKIYDHTVTEVTSQDLQDNLKYWDPTNLDHPRKCPLAASTNPKFAIYTSKARCW